MDTSFVCMEKTVENKFYVMPILLRVQSSIFGCSNLQDLGILSLIFAVLTISL